MYIATCNKKAKSSSKGSATNTMLPGEEGSNNSPAFVNVNRQVLLLLHSIKSGADRMYSHGQSFSEMAFSSVEPTGQKQLIQKTYEMYVGTCVLSVMNVGRETERRVS